ncbi:MAG: hypothetical protein ORO03_08620 [Alphaproteobacteria bacterium]|nr:hypothetical protein [Alphaproteobacteria bacterium]
MYAVNVTPTFTGGIANGVSGNTLRNIGVYLSGTNGTQQIGQLKSN